MNRSKYYERSYIYDLKGKFVEILFKYYNYDSSYISSHGYHCCNLISTSNISKNILSCHFSCV